MNQPNWKRRLLIALTTSVFVGGVGQVAQAAEVTLLNVSYDPTRELYQEFNAVFAKYWKEKTGQDVKVNQSHGGGECQQDPAVQIRLRHCMCSGRVNS